MSTSLRDRLVPLGYLFLQVLILLPIIRSAVSSSTSNGESVAGSVLDFQSPLTWLFWTSILFTCTFFGITHFADPGFVSLDSSTSTDNSHHHQPIAKRSFLSSLFKSGVSPDIPGIEGFDGALESGKHSKFHPYDQKLESKNTEGNEANAANAISRVIPSKKQMNSQKQRRLQNQYANSSNGAAGSAAQGEGGFVELKEEEDDDYQESNSQNNKNEVNNNDNEDDDDDNDNQIVPECELSVDEGHIDEQDAQNQVRMKDFGSNRSFKFDDSHQDAQDFVLIEMAAGNQIESNTNNNESNSQQKHDNSLQQQQQQNISNAKVSPKIGIKTTASASSASGTATTTTAANHFTSDSTSAAITTEFTPQKLPEDPFTAAQHNTVGGFAEKKSNYFHFNNEGDDQQQLEQQQQHIPNSQFDSKQQSQQQQQQYVNFSYPSNRDDQRDITFEKERKVTVDDNMITDYNIQNEKSSREVGIAVVALSSKENPTTGFLTAASQAQLGIPASKNILLESAQSTKSQHSDTINAYLFNKLPSHHQNNQRISQSSHPSVVDSSNEKQNQVDVATCNAVVNKSGEYVKTLDHSSFHANKKPFSAIPRSSINQGNSSSIIGVTSTANVENGQNPFPFIEKRYCNTCFINMPVRAKHCKTCNRCVGKFDHHCPWVGNCIGERNKCTFYVFLFTQIIEIALAFIELIKCANPKESTWPEVIYLVAAGIILVCFFIFTGILFIYHTIFAFRNITTWEYASWEKISYLKEIPYYFGSPFDKGPWENIRSFCTWRIRSRTLSDPQYVRFPNAYPSVLNFSPQDVQNFYQ